MQTALGYKRRLCNNSLFDKMQANDAAVHDSGYPGEYLYRGLSSHGHMHRTFNRVESSGCFAELHDACKPKSPDPQIRQPKPSTRRFGAENLFQQPFEPLKQFFYLSQSDLTCW